MPVAHSPTAWGIAPPRAPIDGDKDGEGARRAEPAEDPEVRSEVPDATP